MPDRGAYSAWAAYGQSKTANILFTVSLNQRFRSQGLLALAVDPGDVQSDLNRHVPEEDFKAMVAHAGIKWKTLEQGASTTCVAGLDPTLDGNEGAVYLADCMLAEPASYAVDEESAQRLWVLSTQLIKQTF